MPLLPSIGSSPALEYFAHEPHGFGAGLFQG
jgi:hypothetical protein